MTNEFEVWKPIGALESEYYISSFGRVKSGERKHIPKEVMLRIYQDVRGTRNCRMSFHNKQKQFNVRKLVWEYFSEDNEVVMASRILYKDKDIEFPDRIDNLYIKPEKTKKAKKPKRVYDVEKMMDLLMTTHDNSDRNIADIIGVNHFTVAILIEEELDKKWDKINYGVNKRHELAKTLEDFKASQEEKFNKFIHTYE